MGTWVIVVQKEVKGVSNGPRGDGRPRPSGRAKLDSALSCGLSKTDAGRTSCVGPEDRRWSLILGRWRKLCGDGDTCYRQLPRSNECNHLSDLMDIFQPTLEGGASSIPELDTGARITRGNAIKNLPN